MRLGWTVATGGCGLELPLRLPGIHTPNEGREEGGVVIVDQRNFAAKSLLVRMFHPHPDPTFGLFVRIVLRNKVSKL